MLRENLAAYAHKTWCGWMRYMFSKSQRNIDGTITIPKWAVDRWDRQCNTPYDLLPEEEKVSDRDEADQILFIIRK
jgi:hypothetical protein